MRHDQDAAVAAATVAEYRGPHWLSRAVWDEQQIPDIASAWRSATSMTGGGVQEIAAGI